VFRATRCDCTFSVIVRAPSASKTFSSGRIDSGGSWSRLENGDRFERQAVGLEILGDDLLHGLGELRPFGIEGVQGLRGRDGAQGGHQLLLDQVLHRVGVAGDRAERGGGLFDCLLFLLDADVEDGLEVGAKEIRRDQRIRAGAVDLQLERPQRDRDDLMHHGHHDGAAVNDAAPAAHAGAHEGLIRRGLEKPSGSQARRARSGTSSSWPWRSTV
jgi:hypothetical protein